MGVVVDINRITLYDIINSEPDMEIKLLDFNPAIKVRFMVESKIQEMTKIYILIPRISGTFAKESMDFALTAYVTQILESISHNKQDVGESNSNY
jgi:hypothetical protein